MGVSPLLVEGQGNQPESSATAYAGLLATLLVAPLAWCSRRHRSLNILWIILGLISLAWVFNIPGLVTLLRVPGLNIMSHNRFVFAATFAVIAMTAVGLEVLLQRPLPRRWWFVLPMAVLLGLGGSACTGLQRRPNRWPLTCGRSSKAAKPFSGFTIRPTCSWCSRRS